MSPAVLQMEGSRAKSEQKESVSSNGGNLGVICFSWDLKRRE